MEQTPSIRLSVLEDHEVEAAVQELFGSASLLASMKTFMPTELYEELLRAKDEVKSTLDFQEKMMLVFLRFVRELSITELTNSGLEQLDPSQKYLFISNHRDIGLDSAYLNKALFEAGFTTTQIAIGDNLMTHRLAELIFRINKSFAVVRSGSPRELYQHSVRMSTYIHEMVHTGKDSIWIAQREGRSKDGNDRTQIGMLKMLSLSKQDDLIDHFEELNIVPVSISYEYDPTGLVKTLSHLRKLNDPEFKKSFTEDIQHILLGIKGQKGHVHFHFGKPINSRLQPLRALDNAKKQLEELVALLDKSIHNNYRLHPINYIACDLLQGGQKYKSYYTSAELREVNVFFEKQLALLPSDQIEDGRKYLLGIYANPVWNREG
ncbi:1-acyl-sn-glycerol-3-phosphate acyltransferase [Lewinella cohaerens]|uniref:1-acyl-sn-glycerol-3-phosphate acyltransferase n=1 Tax=Lewinella cohaerens TaxID=70995 RepID=UPI0003775473|nr:1-acyl-sn-glycerol-3-phosphate acyltransferase [Lewinella cohaerens]